MSEVGGGDPPGEHSDSEIPRLRAACAAVLAQAGDQSDCPESLSRALTELRAALRGDRAAGGEYAQTEADPTRHLVGTYRYEDREKYAIPLGEYAASVRRELASDVALTVDEIPDAVVLTELRGIIIGGLLRELAVRLSPGTAFGPSKAGLELAAVVASLSDELLDQTIVGRQ